MTDFFTAAAAVWQVLALCFVTTAACLYADRESDRQWRAALHREEEARKTATHALTETCRQRHAAQAPARRGQPTPRTSSDKRLRVVGDDWTALMDATKEER